MLKYPDFNKKFTLTTDASNVGLGAVLSQDGHPCCYISRTLNDSEKIYSASEKEMLAVVWAIKRLRQYLLGRKFNVQTDHEALKWLVNVKDPSSRLLKWRLRLEEYDYEVEYKKGCVNKAADALSRVFNVNDTNESDENLRLALELEDALPEIPIEYNARANETRDGVTNNFDLQTPPPLPEVINEINARNITQDSIVSEVEIEETSIWHEKYCRWLENPTESRTIYKPNAKGKLWIKIIKNEMRKSENCVILPPFEEKTWVEKLGQIIDYVLHQRKHTIVRLHLADPSITPIEKIKLNKIIAFFEKEFNKNKFFICLSPIGELSEQEKGQIIRGSHGSTASQHFGENKTIFRARERGTWTNMEKDIIEYVKTCPTCQIYKKTRIRPKDEAIITDTATEPNEKIALDIYGPLNETSSGNRYSQPPRHTNKILNINSYG